MGPHVRRLLELIHRFRLADRVPGAAHIVALAELGKLTESQARVYYHWLQPYVQAQQDRPIVLHKPPDASQLYADGRPDVVLGRLKETDLGFGIRLADRSRHIITAGSTGSGKTTLLRRIVLGASHTLQVVFDRKGGDYPDIAARLRNRWLNTSVHRHMRAGFQAPPGVPVNVWINILSMILAARLGLIASASCLANILRFLVGALRTETTQLWPDLRLVLDVLKSTPMNLWASKAQYGDTLVQALEGIDQASGDLLHTFKGLDVVGDVLNKGHSIVIDIANLFPPALRSVLIDLILAQIFFSSLHTQAKTDGTKVMVVIDEADADISRDADAKYPDGMSVVGQVLKQGREFGIMVVLGVTHLGHISRQVLAAPQYHLIFNQSDAESIFEARRTLVLPPEADPMFPALRPGECIFRQAQSCWTHPMLCQVEYLPPCRLTEPATYHALPYVPSKRLHELPQVQQALEKLIAQHNANKLRRSRTAQAGLSVNGRKLLELAARRPYIPVARLWEQIGNVRPAAQKSVRKELDTELLAAFAESRIGRANVLLVDVLDRGYELVGVDPVARRGRGGIEHRHFAHWIAETLKRKGHKPEIEWIVPGTTHPADVAAQIEGAWQVWEVCVTSIDNIVSHLHACLIQSQVVDTVTLVTPTVTMQNEVKGTVLGELKLADVRNRIKFEVVETYMKELFG